MSPTSLIYPSPPKNVDSRIIDPSPEFRREVVKVLWSILSFIFIYFVLVVAGVFLAILCGYGGIMLIVTFPKLITLALGIGLMGVGVMVLFFLFKFIFSSHKIDRSNLMEITPKEHPLLFEFIRKVASETQAPMPKRVYLSADVNASVFYDSGFWSMFLPVRKNLQIGLGLVNSVNVSEFKAILAHEFGHFSQRSMKLGSYVYNVNKVIYNMLYDNESYKDSLQTWANLSGYFYVFAELTSSIVSGIQSILKLQYTNINEGYMALSRQMEFHADSVAASVSGSMPLITSLRRFEVSDSCYNRVISLYNSWYSNHNRKATNIYRDHTTVMQLFGAEHGLSLDQGLVQVSGGDVFAGIPECRVIIKDQWASHPSTDERENHLKRLDIASQLVNTPAWHLFANPDSLQREVTNRFYENLSFKNEPELVEPSRFQQLFHEENEKYSFDQGYKGFYDGRTIKVFDIKATLKESLAANSLNEVLTVETLKLPLRIAGMQAEIDRLKLICLKTSGIENFEFSNEKFTKGQASAVLQEIHRESDQAKADLEQADRHLFLLYHMCAGVQGNVSEAIDAYGKLFSTTQSTDEKVIEIESILDEVGLLYQGEVTLDKALVISRNMRRKEGPVKKQMADLMINEEYKPYFTQEDTDILNRYIFTEWVYYIEPRLDSEAINLFVAAMNTYGSILSKRVFELKKQIFARQLEIILSHN